MHSQPTHNGMEASLLVDVQLRQEQGGHHPVPYQPPLHPGILNSGAKYQCTATTVVGWDHFTPLPLKKAQEKNLTEFLFYTIQDAREEKVET